jgi:hypothetical protein
MQVPGDPVFGSQQVQYIVQSLRMIGALPLLPLYAFMTCTGTFRSAVLISNINGRVSVMGLWVHEFICREEVPCGREEQ